MSELSDYKRLVEEPQNPAFRKQIAYLQAEVEGLTKALDAKNRQANDFFLENSELHQRLHSLQSRIDAAEPVVSARQILIDAAVAQDDRATAHYFRLAADLVGGAKPGEADGALVEALGWYADPANWETPFHPSGYGTVTSNVANDGGNLARAALRQHKEGGR